MRIIHTILLKEVVKHLEATMTYPRYKCPVCGDEMERDASIFMNHAHVHILEEIVRKHPELGSSDGTSDKAEKYLHDQLVAH